MNTLVVLGAAVWADGPSPTLRRRCDHAARLWHRGQYEAVVVCGGLGVHPPAEAAVMRDVLVAGGVPVQAIHLEDRSTTTLENLTMALPILEMLGADRVTIVTDHYHRPRAWLVARAMGLRVSTAAPSVRGSHMPTQAKQVVRECLALPAYAARLALRKR